MYKTEVLLLAQQVKVVFFDIDGVFTDGRLIYSETHESLKQFNVLDGQGIKWLEQADIIPVVISGRTGKHVEKRLNDLGVRYINLGVNKKIDIAQKFLSDNEFTWSDAAVMGDDWPDLEMIMNCRFSCAPANAHHEVISRVSYVSPKRGGDGAVRDLCDLILVAKGRYNALLEDALGTVVKALNLKR